jgi:hypothetical protein
MYEILSGEKGTQSIKNTYALISMNTKTSISSSERTYLQDLAKQVAEIATSPAQAQRRANAIAINSLESHQPSLVVSPEGAWREILPPQSLRLGDKGLYSSFEYSLLQRLFLANVTKDDTPVDDLMPVGISAHTSGYGVEIPQQKAETHGSYHWDPPLVDLQADMQRLVHRTFTYDAATTQENLAIAQEIFAGILTVVPRAGLFWTAGLTWECIRLRGLEQFMMDMYDDPEGLHALMAWLRDDQLQLMDQMEAAGIVDSNNASHLIGSGGIGLTKLLPTADPRKQGYKPHVGFKGRWGLSESQETVGVSPEMFRDFILPYQAPIFSRFGLLYYGCCEPLDQRLSLILPKAPNLHAISVSPWSDPAILFNLVGRRQVMCVKPNPAHVCVGCNEEAVRASFRKVLDGARDGVLQFILKDTHTIENEPERFARWVQIGREEIARR